MNLLQIAQMTDQQAREYMESIIWPSGNPICPHCNNKEGNYQHQGKSHREGMYSCKKCRKQFTVTVNTVMHRSKLPLTKWLLAFHLMCSSKKGISAHQLMRELDIKSYQTAWHLAHRIRAAMEETPLVELLSGTVEVDETYVGGKPRDKQQGSKRGRGTKKTPVVALIQRDGKAISHSVSRVDSKTLKGAIRDNVDKQANIMTDEWPSYRGLNKEFNSHGIVPHAQGVYSIGDIHVNNAESYFSLLKRGVHGVFHHVSKQHIDRYCAEFSFRWNHRKISDGERTEAAIKGIRGKRLILKEMKA